MRTGTSQSSSDQGNIWNSPREKTLRNVSSSIQCMPGSKNFHKIDEGPSNHFTPFIDHNYWLPTRPITNRENTWESYTGTGLCDITFAPTGLHNKGKSVLKLIQVVEFLGMMLNSRDMTISLLIDKRKKLETLLQETLNKETHPLKDFASLLGKLYSTQPAIAVAPLQLRFLLSFPYLLSRHTSQKGPGKTVSQGNHDCTTVVRASLVFNWKCS